MGEEGEGGGEGGAIIHNVVGTRSTIFHWHLIFVGERKGCGGVLFLWVYAIPVSPATGAGMLEVLQWWIRLWS